MAELVEAENTEEMTEHQHDRLVEIAEDAWNDRLSVAVARTFLPIFARNPLNESTRNQLNDLMKT